MSLQLRSGGGGGMQTSGSAGSQFPAGFCVATGAGFCVGVGAGLRAGVLAGARGGLVATGWRVGWGDAVTDGADRGAEVGERLTSGECVLVGVTADSHATSRTTPTTVTTRRSQPHTALLLTLPADWVLIHTLPDK